MASDWLAANHKPIRGHVRRSQHFIQNTIDKDKTEIGLWSHKKHLLATYSVSIASILEEKLCNEKTHCICKVLYTYLYVKVTAAW